MKIFCLKVIKNREYVRLSTLASQTEKLSEELGLLEKVIAERNNSLKELDKELKSSKYQVKSLTKELSEKDKELLNMGGDLSNVSSSLSVAKEQIRTLIAKSKENSKRIVKLEAQNLEDDLIKKEKDEQMNAMVLKLKEMAIDNEALKQRVMELENQLRGDIVEDDPAEDDPVEDAPAADDSDIIYEGEGEVEPEVPEGESEVPAEGEAEAPEVKDEVPAEVPVETPEVETPEDVFVEPYEDTLEDSIITMSEEELNEQLSYTAQVPDDVMHHPGDRDSSARYSIQGSKSKKKRSKNKA